MNYAAILKEKLNQKRALIVPGAANALAARVIESMGFEAIYLSGAGLTNTFYGLPDLGFINLNDLASHTSAIKDAVALPLIVDADTGFGNAINVRQTIKVLERAGADGVQLEDQDSPKRCGHFNDKSVITANEMVGKIKAAVDTRTNPDFLVIARTDANAVHGIKEALERAQLYQDAGADVIFVEAPKNLAEIKEIASSLSVPQIINIVIGGKTPTLSHDQLKEMGFAMVLYANAALQGAITGMQNALSSLKESGQLEESSGLVASFELRQALVQKPLMDSLELKYK
jgi:2-methylisocitrate lyase-like PEP mutase family enzyme